MPHLAAEPLPLWPQLTRPPSKGPQMTPERPQRVPGPIISQAPALLEPPGCSRRPAGGRPSWVKLPCPIQV